MVTYQTALLTLKDVSQAKMPSSLAALGKDIFLRLIVCTFAHSLPLVFCYFVKAIILRIAIAAVL
jgi:hypothetical protein